MVRNELRVLKVSQSVSQSVSQCLSGEFQDRLPSSSFIVEGLSPPGLAVAPQGRDTSPVMTAGFLSTAEAVSYSRKALGNLNHVSTFPPDGAARPKAALLLMELTVWVWFWQV